MQRLALLVLVCVAATLAFDCYDGANGKYLTASGCKYCWHDSSNTKTGCGKDGKKVKDGDQQGNLSYCIGDKCNSQWLLYSRK